MTDVDESAGPAVMGEPLEPAMSPEMMVLAVEPGRDDAAVLVRCLGALGMLGRLARSEADAMQLLRRELFDAAVVSAELGLDRGSLLQRLAALPSPSLVLAVGPAGAGDLARRARRAGAGAYLARPVDVESLTIALACAGGRAQAHGLYVSEIPHQIRARDSPGAEKGR